MTNISIFPWNDNFNTGLEKVDEQHKRLIELLNLLASHIAFNSDLPGLEIIFKELTDYTVYHFQTEEEIWSKYLEGDAMEGEHKAGHQGFIDQIAQLKTYEGEFDQTVTKVLSFLTRWLTSHILETDREMAYIVIALREGKDLKEAKLIALEKMHGSIRPLIEIILSIYDSLTNNTVLLMQEINERKRAQIYEQFRNRILVEMIREHDLNSLLTEITKGIEAIHPGLICSILLRDKSRERLVNCIGPSLPDFYRRAVDGVPIGDGVGSCGTAAYTGNLVVVEDIASHPYWESYKDLAAKAGLKACWSQPITGSDGEILGAFALYHTTPESPSDEDIQLIENTANLVAIAIEAAENRQQLQIAATAFQSQEGMIITNAEGQIVKVNKAFTNILGYRPEEVINSSPRILLADRYDAHFFNRMRRKVAVTEYWEGELWYRRKEGGAFPTQSTVTAVKDSTGIITHYISTLIDITNEKAASEKIQNLAFYDTLTQLANRRLFFDRLKQAWSTSKRSKKRYALLFIDLDNFKSLNDTLGHDIGDSLLKQIALDLQNHVRQNDTVARLGGDEFTILMDELDSDMETAAMQAGQVGEKIVQALNKRYQLGNQSHHNSCSIGIALLTGEESDYKEPLVHADIAMYQAKEAGRNTLRFFDPVMQERTNAQTRLKNELYTAIQEGQFELYYQPQVDAYGRAFGAEALIRWHHPEKGLILPGAFILMAEQTGLIIPIGDWVIETACRQLKRWEAQPETAHLVLSINLSAAQFKTANFNQTLIQKINATAIDPKKLKLEITESLFLEDSETVMESMEQLRRIGVRFSLDDFGTGYSSLAYIKRLPLDDLKIDQSFIRDIFTDLNDQSIVRTIIAMAESLELNYLAEGVETEAQREFLTSSGCSRFQGFLFSRPLPLAEFEAFVTQRPD